MITNQSPMPFNLIAPRNLQNEGRSAEMRLSFSHPAFLQRRNWHGWDLIVATPIGGLHDNQGLCAAHAVISLYWSSLLIQACCNVRHCQDCCCRNVEHFCRLNGWHARNGISRSTSKRHWSCEFAGFQWGETCEFLRGFFGFKDMLCIDSTWRSKLPPRFPVSALHSRASYNVVGTSQLWIRWAKGCSFEGASSILSDTREHRVKDGQCERVSWVAQKFLPKP